MFMKKTVNKSNTTSIKDLSELKRFATDREHKNKLKQISQMKEEARERTSPLTVG